MLSIFILGGLLSLANFYVYWSMVATMPVDSPDRVIAYSYAGVFGLITCVLIWLLCVFYSHRVVGPAVNISRALASLSAGKPGRHVQLRESDLLHDIADGVNSVSQRVRRSNEAILGEIAQARRFESDERTLKCLKRIENLVTSGRHQMRSDGRIAS